MSVENDFEELLKKFESYSALLEKKIEVQGESIEILAKEVSKYESMAEEVSNKNLVLQTKLENISTRYLAEVKEVEKEHENEVNSLYERIRSLDAELKRVTDVNEDLEEQLKEARAENIELTRPGNSSNLDDFGIVEAAEDAAGLETEGEVKDNNVKPSEEIPRLNKEKLDREYQEKLDLVYKHLNSAKKITMADGKLKELAERLRALDKTSKYNPSPERSDPSLYYKTRSRYTPESLVQEDPDFIEKFLEIAEELEQYLRNTKSVKKGSGTPATPRRKTRASRRARNNQLARDGRRNKTKTNGSPPGKKGLQTLRF